MSSNIPLMASNMRSVKASVSLRAMSQLVGKSSATMRTCSAAISAFRTSQSPAPNRDRRSTCSTSNKSPGRQSERRSEQFGTPQLCAALVLKIVGRNRESALGGEALEVCSGTTGVLVFCGGPQIGSDKHSDHRSVRFGWFSYIRFGLSGQSAKENRRRGSSFDVYPKKQSPRKISGAV